MFCFSGAEGDKQKQKEDQYSSKNLNGILAALHLFFKTEDDK